MAWPALTISPFLIWLSMQLELNFTCSALVVYAAAPALSVCVLSLRLCSGESTHLRSSTLA
jgi:hypothetical protein